MTDQLSEQPVEAPALDAEELGPDALAGDEVAPEHDLDVDSFDDEDQDEDADADEEADS